jgi:hypothetical protein
MSDNSDASSLPSWVIPLIIVLVGILALALVITIFVMCRTMGNMNRAMERIRRDNMITGTLQRIRDNFKHKSQQPSTGVNSPAVRQPMIVDPKYCGPIAHSAQQGPMVLQTPPIPRVPSPHLSPMLSTSGSGLTSPPSPTFMIASPHLQPMPMYAVHPMNPPAMNITPPPSPHYAMSSNVSMQGLAPNSTGKQSCCSSMESGIPGGPLNYPSPVSGTKPNQLPIPKRRSSAQSAKRGSHSSLILANDIPTGVPRRRTEPVGSEGTTSLRGNRGKKGSQEGFVYFTGAGITPVTLVEPNDNGLPVHSRPITDTVFRTVSDELRGNSKPVGHVGSAALQIQPRPPLLHSHSNYGQFAPLFASTSSFTSEGVSSGTRNYGLHPEPPEVDDSTESVCTVPESLYLQ